MTQASTPSPNRSRATRIAAHRMHAMHDSRATTANGRAAFLDRFEREVDPDGLLDPKERAKRAHHAKRAYFLALALKSAQARRRNRQRKAAAS